MCSDDRLYNPLYPPFPSQLCQPVLLDGSTCKDAFNAGRYIEEFTCSAANMTIKRFKDMRLSFPSGHASFACYSMVFLVVRTVYSLPHKSPNVLPASSLLDISTTSHALATPAYAAPPAPVPATDVRLVHGADSHFGLQASLVGCDGRRCNWTQLRISGGK